MKHFILAALCLIAFTGTAIASSKEGPCPPTIIASKCTKPSYPVESLRAGEQGLSEVRFLISTEGKVIDSQLVKASGFARLDEAAEKAFRECPFKPATRDSTPMEVWVKVSYQWAIENSSPQGTVDVGLPTSTKE